MMLIIWFGKYDSMQVSGVYMNLAQLYIFVNARLKSKVASIF